MNISVNLLPTGTHFFTHGQEFEVTSREDYPFIYAKCLTTPNEYENIEVCFCYENVEAYPAHIYEQYFEETSKNHFELKERIK